MTPRLNMAERLELSDWEFKRKINNMIKKIYNMKETSNANRKTLERIKKNARNQNHCNRNEDCL